MAEKIVYLTLLFSVVAGFWFVYGIIETEFRRRQYKRTELKASLSRPATPLVPERVYTTGDFNTFHGYDSSELFREDVLARIRELDSQIAEHNRNIENILAERQKREQS
jgi:hypothetical protein